MQTEAHPPIPHPPARTQAQSRRLSNYGWIGLAGLIGWQVYQTPIEDPLVLGGAIVIMFLAVWPAIKWAKSHGEGLPAYEIMMLTFVPFYAMPLLRGHTATLEYEDHILFRAAFAVIVFQLACMFGHHIPSTRRMRSRLWTSSVLQENSITIGRLGILANTIFVYLLNFTEILPSEFTSILRALFFGIGTAAVFILSRNWGEGRLSPGDKFLTSVVLFFQLVMIASQLYLITVASVVLLGLIGYVTASRKVPIALAVTVFLVLGLLHNGKDEMRGKYWETDYRERVEFGNLYSFYEEWVTFALQDNEEETEVASGILERASLFQIMCSITEKSPESLPYLNGDTYEALPLLMVPRVLWPNKPRPHESNIRLATYYGYVSEAGAGNVSIAFGIPSEAYANFGLIGVALVGMGIGMLFKKVGGWGEGASPLSLIGLGQILLIAWSFQAEMTLAVWLSSLYQASVALLGIPWAYRYFTGQ